MKAAKLNNCKYIFSSFFLYMLVCNISCTQEFSNNKVEKLLIADYFSAALSNYTLGSGFSLLIVQKHKSGKYSMHSLASSNRRSREIIDSIWQANSNTISLEQSKSGFYALPIIQACLVETMDKNDLNWNNNNFTEMQKFAKYFKVPPGTIMLSPLVILITEPQH